MYPLETVYDAVKQAGCEILGVHDAQTWKKPGRKTIRADIIAVRGSAKAYARDFKNVQRLVKGMLS